MRKRDVLELALILTLVLVEIDLYFIIILSLLARCLLAILSFLFVVLY